MPFRYFTLPFSTRHLVFLLLFLSVNALSGRTIHVSQAGAQSYFLEEAGSVIVVYTEAHFLEAKRPSPILHLFRLKKKENRRITAALLAFPFPFGIVGLHRIYLGTAPSVPVVYIASLGGAFGVLPLIDFFVLVFNKDHEKFKNNQKVFMWVE